MTFDINKSIEVLSRTPIAIESLLSGVSEEWIKGNEGEGTWSPYDVVGHLIHGEKTDWIPRAKIILSDAVDKTFIPFDRFAQMQEDQERPIEALLTEFKTLRAQNLEELRSLQLDLHPSKLSEKGIHPDFGEVNLKALLSTWVVHDMGHVAQISRVIAKQYASEVGAWRAYLTILKK